MRIAEYKRIDTQYVEHQRIIPRETETGEYVEDSLCEVETYTEEIPVMGMVYRDATEEEIANAEVGVPEEADELNEDDITEILADHEYRLCLMELGVDVDDL